MHFSIRRLGFLTKTCVDPIYEQIFPGRNHMAIWRACKSLKDARTPENGYLDFLNDARSA